MATQTIEKTFIGTSDPVSLEYSLSYYGPQGLNAEKQPSVNPESCLTPAKSLD